MEFLLRLLDSPLRPIVIVIGLLLGALGVAVWWRWQSLKNKSGAGAFGSNGALVLALASSAFGLSIAMCALALPFASGATQIAAFAATTTHTPTATFTPTPITRTLTLTLVPPPPPNTPTRTSTPRDITPTRTHTATPRGDLPPTPLVGGTPSPRPLPPFIVIDANLKATKCGSPNARLAYNVTIEKNTIKLNMLNGPNKYEGTVNPATGDFTAKGTINIGAGLGEIFEGKLTYQSAAVVLLRGKYRITGQPCEETWEVEGTSRSP